MDIDGNPIGTGSDQTLDSGSDVSFKSTLVQELKLVNDATPDTPEVGTVSMYSKTDSKIYYLDDQGKEREVGGGSSAGGGGIWLFSTSLTGDPGVFNIGFNNATPASVTQISISKTDFNSESQNILLGSMTGGDQLFLSNDDTKAKLYTLSTAGVDNSTYFTFTVSFESEDLVANFIQGAGVTVDALLQNPFNQLLNTSDTPTFAGLNLNGPLTSNIHKLTTTYTAVNPEDLTNKSWVDTTLQPIQTKTQNITALTELTTFSGRVVIPADILTPLIMNETVSSKMDLLPEKLSISSNGKSLTVNASGVTTDGTMHVAELLGIESGESGITLIQNGIYLTTNGIISANGVEIPNAITDLEGKTANITRVAGSTVFQNQVVIDGGVNSRLRVDEITNVGGFTAVNITNSNITFAPGNTTTPTIVAPASVTTPSVILPGGGVQTQLNNKMDQSATTDLIMNNFNILNAGGLSVTGLVQTGTVLPQNLSISDIGSESNKYRDLYLSETVKCGVVDCSGNVLTGNVIPKTTGVRDIGQDGTLGNKYKDLHLTGTVNAGSVVLPGGDVQTQINDAGSASTSALSLKMDKVATSNLDMNNLSIQNALVINTSILTANTIQGSSVNSSGGINGATLQTTSGDLTISETGKIKPQTTAVSDIGEPDKKFREMYIGTVHAALVVTDTITPLTTGSGTVVVYEDFRIGGRVIGVLGGTAADMPTYIKLTTDNISNVGFIDYNVSVDPGFTSTFTYSRHEPVSPLNDGFVLWCYTATTSATSFFPFNQVNPNFAYSFTFLPGGSTGNSVFQILYNGVEVGIYVHPFANLVNTEYQLKFEHNNGVGINVYINGGLVWFCPDLVVRSTMAYSGVAARAVSGTGASEFRVYDYGISIGGGAGGGGGLVTIDSDTNINGNLIVVDAITFPNPFFEAWDIGNSLVTQCTLQNTWYKLNSPGYAITTQDFTTDLTGRIVCTATKPAYYRISFTMTCYPSITLDNTFRFVINKNTTRINSSTVSATKLDSTDRYPVASQCITRLNSGDFLELWVKCADNAGQGLIMNSVNIIAVALPNTV